MTSKSYSDMKIFCHDMRQVFCRSYGALLLGLVLFLLLIPFSTAGLTGNSIFNIEVTHQQMKFRFFLPELAWVLNFAVVVFGLLLGILLFRFLLDKKQTTTFFSLGLSRRALFGSRLFIGLMIIVLVIFIPMAVALGLNIAALGSYPGLWSSFWYLACGMVLLAAVSFFLSIIACVLAGTISEAVCFGVALSGGVSALCYSVNALMKQLLWGNPFGVNTYSGTVEIAENLLERFASYNPVLFFAQSLQERAMFYRSLEVAEPTAVSWTVLLAWCVIAVLLLTLAMYLFRRRRAEQAGISGLNPIFSAWVLFVIGLLAFTLFFCFLGHYHVLAAVIIAVAAFASVYWLYSFLLLGRYQRRRQTLLFIGELLAVSCLAGLIWGGCFGFEQRVPESELVESVTCSYIGSPNYLFMPTSGVSSGNQYYFTCDYTYETAKEIAMVQKIHRGFISDGKRTLAAADDMQDTVLPYDIKIAYTMKNGDIITRYYDRAAVSQLEALLELDNSATVKKGIRTAITGMTENDEVVWSSEAYSHGQIYLADKYYSKPLEVRLSDDKRRELLSAIAQDVTEQSISQRYLPQKPVLGVILFSQDGENSKESFAYQLENTVIYLNDDYQQTLSFLQENDLTQYLAFQGDVESVTLQQYNPYAGINGKKTPVSNYFMGHIGGTLDEFWVQEDFGERHPITQPERLRQLLPVLQNGYFLNDRGYLAVVKLAGEERYAYLYLPESQAPDFIKKK